MPCWLPCSPRAAGRGSPRLRLEDIDWRAGELVVHGKGAHEDRLPLPNDVGQAIAAYLRKGRPNSTVHREVFLRAVAPIEPLTTNGISGILRCACRRAGVQSIGPHRLRHTLACQMAKAGTPLPAIAEVLRHRAISNDLGVRPRRRRRAAGGSTTVAGR
jgi:integrase/recombinase XerD